MPISSSSPATADGPMGGADVNVIHDADVQAMVALVNCSFSDVPDKVIQLQARLGAGMQKALADAWSDEQVEAVYAEAYRLYGEQRYAEALPLALHLSVNRPMDPRFLFTAGMILQLLGDPLLGATFFATLLSIDPEFMPAAFRLAECYAMVGRQDEARAIFEVAIDMGRGMLGDADEFFALQRLIADKLRSMN